VSQTQSLIEIDLGDNGGVHRFRTLRQFHDWTGREWGRWEWLTALPDGGAIANLPTHVSSQLETIESWAEQLTVTSLEQGESPQNILKGHYAGDHPSLIHSASELGRSILAIRRHLGPEKAALAFAIQVGSVGFDPRNVAHVQVLTILANPSLIEPAARRSASRERLAETLSYGEELAGRQAALLQDSELQWAAFRKRAREVGLRLVRRAANTNRRSRGQLTSAVNDALASMASTEAAYNEQMKLQAAVSYWEEKQKSHAANQSATFGHLWKFGAVAGATALICFYLAVVFMLEMSGADATRFIGGRGPTDPPLPTATYLVVTAAVGTILTGLFWVARVLLRIYLTERRLNGDAEERRVMTKTYLALIKDGAIGEEDRLVILNALFRSSEGGVVADDGGTEIALPALIAKLMDQRAAR
jgi:hypothetical protein